MRTPQPQKRELERRLAAGFARSPRQKPIQNRRSILAATNATPLLSVWFQCFHQLMSSRHFLNAFLA
jgi:hypothetical protein